MDPGDDRLIGFTGHTYIDHNYVGHNYIGHIYIGRIHIGHDSGCNYNLVSDTGWS